MEKLILSKKVKKSINRKVWGVWASRKAIPLTALVAVAFIESAMVSFKDVALNAAGATQNIGALSNYVFSAFINAELYALVGAAIILVGGAVFIRGILRDLALTAVIKERV